jgi:hypothetical protein
MSNALLEFDHLRRLKLLGWVLWVACVPRAHAKRDALMWGVPSWSGCGSAAVAEGRGERADGGVLLDVLHPLVVNNVSLRGAGEAKNCGGEATGEDGSKSELLHFDAFFFLCLCRPFLTPLTDLAG